MLESVRRPEITPNGRKAVPTASQIFDKRLDRFLDQFGKHFAAKSSNRKRLAAIITEALDARGPQHWADKISRCNLHEIAKPLGKVIKLLDRPRNWDIAIKALSDDGTWGGFLQAEQRYSVLLRDLRKISSGVPPLPKRKRQRPVKTKDLYALVDRLATYWEEEMGKPFRQSWHRDESAESTWQLNPTTKLPEEKWPRIPTNHATQFVYDVVELVNPLHLYLLPKVTERIVAERKKRRAVTSRK
jgi:hypothetical protein